MTKLAKMAISAAAILAALCGTALAAPSPDSDQPVCAQGTWAMQGDEKKYVCLAWRFRGQIYSLPELEQVLAQLNRGSPAPPQANPQPSGTRAAPPRAETPNQKKDCTASIPSMSVTISFPCDVKDSLKALLE
jgi:hypothetical protein